jgi:hypothetical protein
MLPDLKKVENLMPPNQSDSSSAHMVYKYGGVTYFSREASFRTKSVPA